ncbi:MAG: hypothetical protein ACRENI_03790 [Gemmatimonadaceae bacterium]
MSFEDWDFSELEKMWKARREAARPMLRRIDPRGMTRPARDPEERAWLDARGEGVFVETEENAELWRAYYARKYRREP